MSPVKTSNVWGVHSERAVQYRDELGAEIVSESKYDGDKFNLGKIALKTFEKYPEKVHQINAATGEQETNGALRRRVLACCRVLADLGVQKGDVLALVGLNHLDVCVPYIAGFVCGVIILPLDPNLAAYELKHLLSIGKPRIVFCDSNKVSVLTTLLRELTLESNIVAFSHGGVSIESPALDFGELIAKHYDEDGSFRIPSFDSEETIALIGHTSGTSGLPKGVLHTHKSLLLILPYTWTDYQTFPEPTKSILLSTSIHGMMATLCLLQCFLYNVTRIQTSKELTPEHTYFVINKYKPTYFLCGTSFAHMLLSQPNTDECDLTCFEQFFVGGSGVSDKLIRTLRERMPECKAVIGYGMSEVGNVLFRHSDKSPIHSVGQPMPIMQYKIIDNLGKEILEPNVTGELLVKGDNLFKGYYNDEEATKETMASDGFFKTGDLVYRDEANNYFYVDRSRLLIKYRNYQISPQQTEEAIMTHPGVAEVLVCGIPNEADAEHTAACVVRAKNAHGETLTEQDIEDLVKNTLSPNNQLRGGVLFLERIPRTASEKLDRRATKKILIEAKTK